jgi:quercetin dioxygenase-like cupin family protein
MRTRSWHLTLTAIAALAVGAPAAQTPQPAIPTQSGAAAALQAQPANPRAGNSIVMETDGLLVQRRLFEAGNRTYWHSHEKGFLLLVEKGRARVQKAGEPMKDLGPGEVDYTPPNVLHWHGAGPDDEFIQVGVSFGGGITFTEPVSDAEYHGR